MAIEVAAIVLATLALVIGGARATRASCDGEVSAVRSAIARYEFEFGNVKPRSLVPLVTLRLLDRPLEATSPSATAGFVYDATNGTYAGGTCANA